MKKRRRAAKSRSVQALKERDYNKLYREVKKQVQQTNERLKSLERRHAAGTWASGKLKTRIRSNKTKGLMYKGKRVKLKKYMSKTNLVQVQKATKQFLESATSTNKGIKGVRENTIKSLKDTLNWGREKGKRLSDKDAEFLYGILEDKQPRDLIKELGASLVFFEVGLAIENHYSRQTFIDRLNSYLVQEMDEDLRSQAEHIYNTYVLGSL